MFNTLLTSNNSRKLVVILLHLLLLFTPFLWTTQTYELFEFPKMMFTYLLTVLILCFWAIRMVLEKQWLITKTPFDRVFVLFLISQIISTIFSINVHTSLFGYYSRFNGGLLSTTTFLVLFYAAVSNLTKSDLKKLLLTLVLALTATSFYSFPEHFGASPSCVLIGRGFNVNCWIQDVQHRVFGTFGQPNWQAAYIITLIFIPLAYVKHYFKQKNTVAFILFSATTLLGLTVLIFTKSRSGVLAFSLGFALYWFIQLLQTKFRLQTLKSAGVVTAAILLLFAIFGQDFLVQLSQLPKRVVPQAAQTTSPQEPVVIPVPQGGTESGDIRKIVWLGAFRLFQNYPFFGSGVETFGYAYYYVRPAAHNLVSEWDFLYNKAHNEFLNLLATTGLFGLTTYLLLIGSYYVWILRIFRSQKLPALEQNLLLAFLSGHLALNVSNFFGFSTVSVQQLFYLFPAFSLLLVEENVPEAKAQRDISTNQKLVLTAIFFVTAFLIHQITLRYATDITFTTGKKELESADLQSALQSLQQAVRAVPSEPLYLDYLSLATAQAAATFQNHQEPTLANQFADQAESFSDRTLALNPVHLNFYKTRARVFAYLSSLDESYVQKAISTLQTAIRLAPTDPKLQLNLGLLYSQTNKFSEAEAAFKNAIKLKPNYEAAYIQLGKIYEAQEKYPEAAKQYQTILDEINPQNPDAIQRLTAVSTMSAQTDSAN